MKERERERRKQRVEDTKIQNTCIDIHTNTRTHRNTSGTRGCVGKAKNSDGEAERCGH